MLPSLTQCIADAIVEAEVTRVFSRFGLVLAEIRLCKSTLYNLQTK